MNDRKNPTLHHIAETLLGLETLETRNSDHIDFHELAIWQIEEALRAAYEAGVASEQECQTRHKSVDKHSG